ncbi:hypothetical protein NE237_018254 [Protea cynaroides]|uniref:Uncharacterized protein n=1 Tax=Protea cynaroides TaxID=273540 RepID=A0A9Q0QNT9_9MAGN|nr:hypothetical protein NE237_018254 [Protea cynaroides]
MATLPPSNTPSPTIEDGTTNTVVNSTSPPTAAVDTTSLLVISNITNLTIKLMLNNYLLWKSLFEPILRGHKLMHLLDGTTPTPVSAESPWYVNALFLDQCYTRQFNSSIRIRARTSEFTLEDLNTLLICEELALADETPCKTSAAFVAYKLDKTNSGHGSSSFRGRNSYGGRGNHYSQRKPSNKSGLLPSPNVTSTNSNQPQCQICHRMGHLAIDCFHRMDYVVQGRHPVEKLAAMVSSTMLAVDTCYKKLYDFFYNASGKILDEGEKMGIQREEACHNLLFATCFNSYGGMKILFPSLLKFISQAGVKLHKQLAKEIRMVVQSNGGTVTMSGMEQMELMKSVVYKTLRIYPPVPLQYGKAKKDLV